MTLSRWHSRWGRWLVLWIDLCLMLAVLTLSGVKESRPQAQQYSQVPVTNRTREWTVLIYMCGTDLESRDGAATANLQEICSLGKPDNINILIQTGGTRDWKLEGVREDVLSRFEVVEQGLRLCSTQSAASMGERRTLGEFLRWGVENYPARRYMVLLWNHGGGSLGGVCYDEQFGNDSLSLTELAGGLAMAGVRFEVIGFDACLMATLENAAAMRSYGRFMVASQEFVPGGGWDYDSWLGWLDDHPDAGGAELGQRICTDYYAKCEASGDASMATMSVIELEKTEKLLQCFDALASEMGSAVGELGSLRELAQRALRAENYGGNNEAEGYTNMVDLGDLVESTRDVLPGTSQELLDALRQAVIFRIQGRHREGSQGLSVFLPLDLSAQSCGTYVPICPSDHYLRFLEAVVPDFTAPAGLDAPPLEVAGNPGTVVEMRTLLDDQARFTVEITSGLESVQEVNHWLFYVDRAYEEYVIMGVDNDLIAYWDEGIFQDNFRGVWPAINGYYCAPVLVDEGGDYNIYSVPILLNDRQTNLRVAYIWDGQGGHYEIYGAWEGVDSDTGAVSRQIRRLEDGDRVEFIFTSIDWHTGRELYYTMGGFTVDGELIMEEVPLVDGDYLYAFEITDVFGRASLSDFAVMSCENGEVYVSLQEDELPGTVR